MCFVCGFNLLLLHRTPSSVVVFLVVIITAASLFIHMVCIGVYFCSFRFICCTLRVRVGIRVSQQCRRRQQVKLLLELLSVDVTWAEVLFGNCLWRLYVCVCVLTCAHRLMSMSMSGCLSTRHVCVCFMGLASDSGPGLAWACWTTYFSTDAFRKRYVIYSFQLLDLLQARNETLSPSYPHPSPYRIEYERSLHKEVKWRAHKLKCFKRGLKKEKQQTTIGKKHFDEQKAINSGQSITTRDKRPKWEGR